MRKFWLFFGSVFCSFYLHGQIANDTIDTKYLEDQWYLSFSYNILNNTPSQIAQNGFSGGFSTGIIKDIPFNENRNMGIGFGFGYSYDVYVQNLKVSAQNGAAILDVAPATSTNLAKLHKLEFPFEIRWRSSRPDRYKFWTIYPGFKIGYLVLSKTKFKEDKITIKTKNLEEFNKWQYGLTLSTGYSTWNLSLYYGLSSLFNNTTLENEKIDLKEMKIGLIFYII